MKKPFILGLAASLFFSFTFILNRQMNLSGGSWIYSASLRYLFMLPILFLIVLIRNELKAVLHEIKTDLGSWMLWSTVGFGIFYAPITFAAAYGPSWLMAGMWQTTIIAGALLSPLFKTNGIRNRIPLNSLAVSSIILAGVFIMQMQASTSVSLREILLGTLPVLVAAFAYPLGNRKMMEVCGNRLNTLQRVFGMTLCSLPFWLALGIYGLSTVGLPSVGQLSQSLIVAISSGVIATLLFFKSTNLARSDAHALAAVESTQAGEVVFTLLLSVLLLHDTLPKGLSLLGLGLIILGMILNSVKT
jgi:drug/metabolite transporter (DMT)-like permease